MTDYTNLIPAALVVAALFALLGLGLWLEKVLANDDLLGLSDETTAARERLHEAAGEGSR